MAKLISADQVLADIQATPDERRIPIDQVGVRRVKYPIQIRERDNGLQSTVGEFSLTVDLPQEFKGTHMSRFLEVLSEHNHDLSPDTIPHVLARLQEKLHAETAHLTVSFTLFREKSAPVTGKKGMMGYECGFTASAGRTADLAIHVTVPVATLCPCSKEISDYGAHNQRGYVSVNVWPGPTAATLWLEDLIEMIESAASSPLYPVLKRPDEKFVTEQAYDNPRFVEDMVREVAIRFDRDSRIAKYRIEVENHESIHDHNAFAMVERSAPNR